MQISTNSQENLKKVFRILFQAALGVFLLYAGTLHLTTRRSEFQAQVPSWLPVDADFVVIASGVVEIALGLSLLILRKWRRQVGILTAIFFVLIFPGNIWQYIDGIDAFGLDTDRDRFIRLFFQPVLVLWALWSTRTESHQKS
jgi:uncharacterized membrane protein